tara:strand:- start:152 stop:523 length:372 start_codon:yes stop_codon:yes gene_type:complete
MGFKLGSEKRGFPSKKNHFDKCQETSIPGTPIIRKNLGKGIKAEANIDGSIFLSNKVEPGSEEERRILMHEMKHLVDMRIGKLSYTDEELTWMGETYKRDKGHIRYNGKWLPEGSKEFPWEQH